MALPEHLSGLLDPGSYPHPCAGIELIETHISWILLTGSYAYKLKKPVAFNFLDFSTLERREHFCREEVRCNRAFAPELYLGLARICAREGGVRVLTQDESLAGAPEEGAADRDGPLLEWAVWMRQFDPEMALDRLLARGALPETALDAFGRDLADRHAVLPVRVCRPEEVDGRVFGPVRDNFAEIRHTTLGGRHADLVGTVEARSESLGQALRSRFEARLEAGAVRECHGDLHLSNLALIDGRVTAFDCLEFNENLRWIDTMSDVAFLFMDCHVRGQVAMAYRFLDSYLNASGDYTGATVKHYFDAYRSVVRAKVSALRFEQAGEAGAAERFTAHLEWARAWLHRPPGSLILTCGLSGSGKSTLARALLPRLPAVRLRSDVARKRLAGLDPLAASDSGIDSGLYDPGQTARTFDYLAATAEALLRAGEHVIMDATFIERARRELFYQLARRIGVPVRLVLCQAPEGVLAERLRARAAAGGDPSEATLEVLAYQKARFEAPAEDEPVVEVDMVAELTPSRIEAIARRLGFRE